MLSGSVDELINSEMFKGSKAYGHSYDKGIRLKPWYGFLYIAKFKTRDKLKIGITSDLEQRDQQLKNKKRAKQRQKAVLKADISSLFIGVFLVSILEFFILGYSVLFEQDNIDFMKELESFLLYEEFGISQGYFLVPLLFLSSFLRTNQELKQGLVIQGNLFKKTRKKAFIYLFSTRFYVLAFAFLISLLRLNFSFLIWMLIFSVLMYQRILFWKKTENKAFE